MNSLEPLEPKHLAFRQDEPTVYGMYDRRTNRRVGSVLKDTANQYVGAIIYDNRPFRTGVFRDLKTAARQTAKYYIDKDRDYRAYLAKERKKREGQK